MQQDRNIGHAAKRILDIVEKKDLRGVLIDLLRIRGKLADGGNADCDLILPKTFRHFREEIHVFTLGSVEDHSAASGVKELLDVFHSLYVACSHHRNPGHLADRPDGGDGLLMVRIVF